MSKLRPIVTPARKNTLRLQSGLREEIFDRLWSGTFTDTDYFAYICNPVWLRKRKKCITQMGNVCYRCHAPIGQRYERGCVVHHKLNAYKRLFRERVGVDIIPLCWPCHRREHKRVAKRWRKLEMKNLIELFAEETDG